MAEQTYHQNGSYMSLQESVEEDHQIENMGKDEESKGSLNDLLLESQDHMQGKS